MPEREPTCIGRVRHVLGATVTVELDESLAGVAPLWQGRLQPIGQVGSLVRIPQGPVNLIATVTLVGIAELAGALSPSPNSQSGERWLQVQLLGEVDGLGRFNRGVSTYPGLDDAVHFTTKEDLDSVFPKPSPDHAPIGFLAAAPDVAVTLLANRLVTRHSAVVGSTGSGKTSAVATILQSFLNGGWTSANIVVIDPHGEYAAAVPTKAAVRSVLSKDGRLLRVPFWALPAADVFRAFCVGIESPTAIKRFSDLVTEARRSFASAAKWLTVEDAAINSDTPIPFDIRSVWFKFDYENKATYEKPNGQGAVQVSAEGDAAKLQSAVFKQYSPTNTAPYKGPNFGIYGTAPELIRQRLLDERYRFFLEPSADPNGDDPLPSILNEWLGVENPVSVLDFSGVPSEMSDLAIGVVLQLLFDVAIHSPADAGIGRSRPVLIVLEEAHRYLGEGPTNKLARTAANRIAREGRKYGVGLMLVTQRPSELPDTALSQCGTIVALRLTNSGDQSTVKAALPDSVAGLADALPSLRTGEALISGEAVTLPTRALLTMPSPPPSANDPTLASWRKGPQKNTVEAAVAAWRGFK